MDANPGFAGTRAANLLFKTTGYDTINNGILSVTASPALDLNNISTNAFTVFAVSTLGSYQPMIASSYYVGGSDVNSVNGAAQISYNTATSTMALQAPNVSFPLSTITGVSSINGSPYTNTFIIPSAVFVSTLEAADYVSTISLQGISSIVGVTNLDMTTGNLNIVGATTLYLVDGGGGGLEVTAGQPRITGSSGLVIDNNLSVSTITNISTINGTAFPSGVPILGHGIIDNTAIQAANWVSAGAGSETEASFALPGFVTLSTSANVSVNMINGSVVNAANCWVITVNPGGITANELQIVLADDPSATDIELSWVVYSN
jgi:hypothetical protein